MHATLWVLLLAIGAADPPPCERHLEQKKLQGKWHVVRAVYGGVDTPKEDLEELAVIIHDNGMRIEEGDKVNDQLRFKLDPGIKPRGIDLEFITGKKKGRVDRAVYHLEGSTLKICIQEDPKGERPSDFISRKGSQVSLLVLKRAPAK
jgi:uncharacterized protein (TIGR03067 family)